MKIWREAWPFVMSASIAMTVVFVARFVGPFFTVLGLACIVITVVLGAAIKDIHWNYVRTKKWGRP